MFSFSQNCLNSIAGIEQHIWSSEPEVGNFLSALIKLNKIKDIIEVGTFKGLTSSFLIDSIPEDGSFLSVDIEDCRENSVKEYFKKNNKKAKFVLEDSCKFLKSLPERSADLIFLDSFHGYDHVKREFKHSERVIKQGGLICVHDYYSAFDGVGRWINEIKKMNWFETLILNTPKDRGLVVCRCLHINYPKI